MSATLAPIASSPVHQKNARAERDAAGAAQAVQLKRELRGMDFAAGAAALAPDAPVQRAGRGGAEADVRALATAGLQGGGSALPYAERIQAAFGHHDIGAVRAHQGAGAAAAARGMGAEAYATGQDVVFGGAPSLHTAAHEAAHVVQQRAGVALKGGVGQVGDAYERHADAVADAVVAGRSAEGLLDAAPGGGGGGAQGAVQRKIGFEFETDALVRRSTQPGQPVWRDGQGGEPLKKMDSLTPKKNGLDMQVDTNPMTGSVIEFVSDPFDVTKEGRTAMVAALDQLQTWSGKVESMASGEDLKTMDYKPLASYIGGDPRNYGRPQFRPIYGNPQVSAGLSLEELHGVLGDWSEAGQKGSKAPAVVKPLFQRIGESPESYREMVTALAQTSLLGPTKREITPFEPTPEKSEGKGRPKGDRLRQLQRLGGDVAVSKPLQSLVWLIGSYLKTVALDGQTQKGKPFANSKELTVLMARNNFASLYAELPEAERHILTARPNLLVDIVGRAAGVAMEEKIYPCGFLKGANKQTVEFGLTRAEWVRGITAGKDLLTKDFWESGYDPEVDQGLGDKVEGGKSVHKSLGGYKSKDTDRGYEQAIFEFRKIPGGISAKAFASQMSKTWDYLESKMKAPKEKK